LGNGAKAFRSSISDDVWQSVAHKLTTSEASPAGNNWRSIVPVYFEKRGKIRFRLAVLDHHGFAA
jgi:hypothetical protein